MEKRTLRAFSPKDVVEYGNESSIELDRKDGKRLLQTFTLTLPSEMRMLSVVRACVEAICETGNLDSQTTHAIVLAAGEAVSNVIRHAHRDRPDAPIQVECRLECGSFEIIMRDCGLPFDLEGVPNLNPAELRIGGRGVYMMRKLMDEVSCKPIEHQGNILRMVKRWTPAENAREVG